MAEAIVGKLEDSGSFGDAKWNMNLVEKIKTWTPELLRRLEATIEQNTQVRGAFGVPQKIRALVAKHGTES